MTEHDGETSFDRVLHDIQAVAYQAAYEGTKKALEEDRQHQLKMLTQAGAALRQVIQGDRREDLSAFAGEISDAIKPMVSALGKVEMRVEELTEGYNDMLRWLKEADNQADDWWRDGPAE